MYDVCMSCTHVQCRLYNCMCVQFLSFTITYIIFPVQDAYSLKVITFAVYRV